MAEGRKTKHLQGKSVLLIEDNDELRIVVKLLLESLGMVVIESDGTSLDFSQPDIDIVLSDVVLPGLAQGPDLIKDVQSHYPNIAVIYMSGYPKDRLGAEENLLFIRKPFTLDELRDKLAESLQVN